MLVGLCLQCSASAIWFVTIGDILRHRLLSLFGHVARLDPSVPARDALVIWRRPPGRPRNAWLNKIQKNATVLLYDVGICDRRNGSLGLSDGDDDDEGCKTCQKWRVKLIFQGTYRHRDC